jgi:hypothetical protein
MWVCGVSGEYWRLVGRPPLRRAVQWDSISTVPTSPVSGRLIPGEASLGMAEWYTRFAAAFWVGPSALVFPWRAYLGLHRLRRASSSEPIPTLGWYRARLQRSDVAAWVNSVHPIAQKRDVGHPAPDLPQVLWWYAHISEARCGAPGLVAGRRSRFLRCAAE